MATLKSTCARLARPLTLSLLFALAACGGGGAGDAGDAGAEEGTGPLPVYLLLGQSNMVGNKADPALLPAQLQHAQAETLIFDKTGWLELAPGAAQDVGFGPEITFGRDMPGTIGIVKVAGGGTTLAEHWNPRGNLYALAMKAFERASASRRIQVRAILWMQGETDGMTQAHAEAYEANLEETVAALRSAVGHVPFVLCRVNPPVDQYPYAEIVRHAQANAAIEDFHWMDCDGLSKVEDGIHFDAAGQVQLGRMFAAAIAALH